MRNTLLFLFTLFLTSPSLGAEVDNFVQARITEDSTEVVVKLTGNFRYDMHTLLSSGSLNNRISGQENSRRKLPPKIPQSIALSLVLPGAGQYYNGDQKRSMAFITAELLLVGSYFNWKRKGNNGIDVYQDYAHASWSPRKYATWLNEFSGYTGADIDLPNITDEQFQNPSSWNEDQIVEVRRFFNNIRDAEGSSFYLTTGASFSHVLPYFGEQQYYELIGKYFQYAPGWSDYTANPDEDAEVVIGNDPDSQFLFYDDIHTEANTYLRKASRMTGLIFAVHFAAAVEAAVSAKIKNDRYKVGLSINPSRDGTYSAMAGVTIRL